MFSIMMTAESTMMPKSTAPSDNRMASSPRSTRMMMAKNSAKGILAPTMMALRRSPRNTHTDQRAAIVIRNDLHAGRQAAVGVQPLHLRMNARKDFVGMLGASHHHDGGGDVVIMVPARDAEPRHVADRHIGDVLDLDREPVGLGQDDVLDGLHMVAVGGVGGPAAVDEANAADIDRLLADDDLAAADIDVGVAERGDQL